VARLKKLYDTLDTGTTPLTVLIPWFPTPAMIQKLWATKDIYEIVVGAIAAREASGIPRDDALQMLLDSGDEKLVIVGVSVIRLSIRMSTICSSGFVSQFIMGLLIAGARATGTTGKNTIVFCLVGPYLIISAS
jgi:hypothetical protein